MIHICSLRYIIST